MSAMRFLVWACFCLTSVEFVTAQVDCATAATGTICNDAEGCGCFDLECKKPDYSGVVAPPNFPTITCDSVLSGSTYSVATPCTAQFDECVTSTAGYNGGCAEIGLAGYCGATGDGAWLCVPPDFLSTPTNGDDCNPAEGCTCLYGICANSGEEDGYCEEAPACDPDMDICGDPHMKGLRGQKIDWFGVDGGWYSFIMDEDADVHINVRLTAPLPEEFPDRQLVTGLSVISGGHSLVLKVKNPYETDISGDCPDGIPTPCLANGGLSVTVDGEETVDDSPLLHPIRGETLPGGSIEVSAANLPVECWEFGGDKIWARHYEDMMAQERRTTGESFEDWVLSFQHTTAHEWCTKHITEKGLSDVQSPHAIYQIVTPSVVVRLNVGIGYQTGGELEWDGRVLPDLDVWQMDIGLVGLSLENEGLTGILGETARPVYDKHGHAVMKGDDAFRGIPEDYRVSGELRTDFALLHNI